MANYEYVGCVTGFSESGQVTVWQPEQIPLEVEHTDNEYTQRLLGVGLLQLGKS